MAEEQNKATARRLYQTVSEGLKRGNLDQMDEFVAHDVRDHNPEPGQDPGLDGLKRFFLSLRDAFPDLEISVEDMIAEGDKVVTRALFRGTHRGDYQGMPASGKQMVVEVIDILRLENGKVVERWGLGDQLGMMQQLGMSPA